MWSLLNNSILAPSSLNRNPNLIQESGEPWGIVISGECEREDVDGDIDIEDEDNDYELVIDDLDECIDELVLDILLYYSDLCDSGCLNDDVIDVIEVWDEEDDEEEVIDWDLWVDGSVVVDIDED